MLVRIIHELWKVKCITNGTGDAVKRNEISIQHDIIKDDSSNSSNHNDSIIKRNNNKELAC